MVFDNPYLRKFLGLGGVIRRFVSSYKTSPTIVTNFHGHPSMPEDHGHLSGECPVPCRWWFGIRIFVQECRSNLSKNLFLQGEI